jgi:transcriptional regulator with PAS, ATPase and Fis domain
MQDKVATHAKYLKDGMVIVNKDKYSRNVDIVGSSKEIRSLLSKASRVAKTDCSVLILGETGVGKELLARFIHENSNRKKNPFIAINCSTLPDTLFESELFGYKEGAFTGANKKGKIGLVEAAQGGTLFLDEIGELSPLGQAKLLRFLQSNTFIPIGSTKEKVADVRIVSATNRDLENIIGNEFRADLFYRLATVTLEIPPLRNRKSDIGDLIDYFLKYYNFKYGFDKVISPAIKQLLQAYHWPGNVRELQHTIESAIILSEGREITYDDLPARIINNRGCREQEISINGIMPLSVAKSKLEQILIRKAIEQSRTLQEAADLLEINPSTLYRHIKKATSKNGTQR